MFPRKFIHCPRNFLFVPRSYCVSCADFLFPTFLGMPWCRDYVIVLLLCVRAEFESDMVDVGFILLSSHHHHSHRRRLSSFATVDILPHRAPPLYRGMWADDLTNGSEGRRSRGDPISGRPTRCVAKRGMTFIVPRFSLFLFSPTSPLTAPEPSGDVANHARTKPT